MPWSRTWGLLALALGVILLALPLGRFAGFAPLAYATVCLGLTNPPKVAILRSGDYSYGIYVYAYPVQQVFASLGPWAHHWWLNILVCVPASTMVAAVSWHLVEKPALGLRKPLKALEDHWLVARGKLTLRPAE